MNNDNTNKSGLRRRSLLLGSTSLVAASAVMSAAAPRTATAATSEILPTPEPPFNGTIERTLKGSVPDFPKGVEARPARPMFS